MENGDVKEDSSPVKDTIAQAVEEEEKESAPVEAWAGMRRTKIIIIILLKLGKLYFILFYMLGLF